MAESTPTLQWRGASGNNYLYYIYPIGHSLKDEGGNYIFAYKKDATTWQAVYYGQTKSLAERFDNHHKADCIRKAGATHILAHLNGKESDRLAEEADLLARGKPTCND